MKRILSMLLVLCMVISMLPLAVFAADTFTGTATADGDGKYTKNFTPGADGTLTVTVGDGTTNWSADVAFFGDSLSMESVGTCSGSESDSFSAEVVAGTKYYVRVWATDGNGLSDTPVSYTFVPASGEEDAGVVVEGTVLNDDAGAAMKGTDVEIPMITDSTGNAPYAGQQEHFFTPTTDGILTVHIIGSSSDWWYSGENLCGMVTGSGEWAETYEVRAGTTYSITLGCYEDWNQASGTISYEVLFYAKELAAVQEKFMFADSILVGEKAVAEIVPDAEAPVTAAVTMMDNAASTVVGITPDVVGVYTVTVSEGATVADMGTNGTLIELFVDSAVYGDSVVWTCKEVSELKDTTSEGVGVYTQGQTLFVGIKSDAETVHVTVEKTGDYEVVEVELQTYENKAELSQFTLPEEATLGDYINISDSVDHAAVLGNDGYYHLDSANGPILLVDMDYASIVLTDALTGGRGTMYAFVVDENGETVAKYDIANACRAYEAVCDENGYYPLTEDLVFFYQTYGVGNWVYGTVLDASMMNDEDVWMYCMRTMTLPGEEGGDAATSGTLSVPSYESVDWTAPASGTVTFTVDPADAVAVVFNAGEYVPLVEITSGSATLEVVEGNAYSIMNPFYETAISVAWEFGAAEEEPDVPDAPEQSAALVLGENALSVAAGDRDGGSWTFTAAEAGALTATVTSLTQYYEDESGLVPDTTTAENFLSMAFGRGFQFLVNGNNAFTNTQTVNVAAGDVVTVQLINPVGGMFDAVLTLSMGAAEEPAPSEPDGSSLNPFVIESLPYEGTYAAHSDVYYNYTAPVAQTLLITVPTNQMYVSGVGTEKVINDDGTMTYTYEIAAGDTVCINPWGGAVSGAFTVVAAASATDLVLGDNALSVEANDLDGGAWTYTATEAGALTATVTSLTQYIEDETA